MSLNPIDLRELKNKEKIEKRNQLLRNKTLTAMSLQQTKEDHILVLQQKVSRVQAKRTARILDAIVILTPLLFIVVTAAITLWATNEFREKLGTEPNSTTHAHRYMTLTFSVSLLSGILHLTYPLLVQKPLTRLVFGDATALKYGSLRLQIACTLPAVCIAVSVAALLADVSGVLVRHLVGERNDVRWAMIGFGYGALTVNATMLVLNTILYIRAKAVCRVADSYRLHMLKGRIDQKLERNKLNVPQSETTTLISQQPTAYDQMTPSYYNISDYTTDDPISAELAQTTDEVLMQTGTRRVPQTFTPAISLDQAECEQHHSGRHPSAHHHHHKRNVHSHTAPVTSYTAKLSQSTGLSAEELQLLADRGGLTNRDIEQMSVYELHQRVAKLKGF